MPRSAACNLSSGWNAWLAVLRAMIALPFSQWSRMIAICSAGRSMRRAIAINYTTARFFAAVTASLFQRRTTRAVRHRQVACESR